MEQRNLTNAVMAACRLMRDKGSSSESELRQALENGDWMISFSEGDHWGEDVCVEPGEPIVIGGITLGTSCKRTESVGGWH